MSKLQIVSYKSFFRVEEIVILNDYLDTDTGKKDNKVSSYIKINIERFLSFLEEKLDFYENDFLTYEAADSLKECIRDFKLKNVQILGLK